MTPEERMQATRVSQQSAEWFTLRCGRVTGSNMTKVMSLLKRASKGKQVGESSATRENYKLAVISELLTGIPVENYVSPAMDTGRELEPIAVAEYEFQTGLETEKTGFWVHPSIDRFGASPDRLVSEDGLLEVKCPLPTTHIEYMIAGKMPDEYVDQVQAELVCTERQWCDFVSFCPVMPSDLRLFQVRVTRDEKRIAELEAGVIAFLEEVVQAIETLRGHATPLKEKLRASLDQEMYLSDEDFVGLV
jgi:putative phage-type endonuclease